MPRNKIKVNLLTFNCALSYGAVLQTYALTRVLDDLNCDVELIDFRAPFLPPVPTGLWTLKKNYNLTRFRKELLFYKFRKKHLNGKTRAICSSRALKRFKFDADYYIVGSDQVWNPDITKKYALNYFLDFTQGNKISYAASFGKVEWNYSESFTKQVGILLGHFNAISVRENQAVKLVSEKFNLKAEVVLDPTLLGFDIKEILPTLSQKQQIATFSLNYDEGILRIVQAVNDVLKIPAYAVDTKHRYGKMIPIPYPSVEDWIKYFAESSFIVTDSFHGVVLSIFFQKDFLVVNSNPRRFIRIHNLLQQLNLLDRIINQPLNLIEPNVWLNKIDYRQVYDELNVLRIKSYNFLHKALNISKD